MTKTLSNSTIPRVFNSSSKKIQRKDKNRSGSSSGNKHSGVGSLGGGLKRRVNSRNTIKNIVNQMISFLSSPECYPILESLCKNKALDLFNLFQSIIRHVKRYRRKIKTIDELINMWRNQPNCPEEFSAYLRVLSRYFLERESIVRIITSKYVKDKSYHLEIRRYLLETLKSLHKSEVQALPSA